MADDDKKVIDPKVDEKPEADEKPTDEPKLEEPEVKEPEVDEKPAGDTATSAGTDQHGRQIYNVKCSSCGKDAQVPFKPAGDRPVYCRDCYMQQRGGGMNRGPGR